MIERRTVASIVSRTDPAAAAREIASRLKREVPSYSGLDEGSLGDEITALTRAGVASFLDFVQSGREVGEDQLQLFLDAAHLRARQGIPLEDLLRAYRIGAHVSWRAACQAAKSQEHSALALGADLLMDFVDRLSTVEAEAHTQERGRLKSDEAHRARRLLELLVEGRPVAGELREADRGSNFSLTETHYRPFACTIYGSSPQEHEKLARRLVAHGHLAVSHSQEISGVLSSAKDLPDLAEPCCFAVGEETARDEVKLEYELTRLVVRVGVQLGLTGRVDFGALWPEVLLAQTPHAAEKVSSMVCAPLAQREGERTDLLNTVATYIGQKMDRRNTASALHVHPNTLTYRLARFEELTGLGFKRPDHIALISFALKQQRLETGKEPLAESLAIW